MARRPLPRSCLFGRMRAPLALPALSGWAVLAAGWARGASGRWPAGCPLSLQPPKAPHSKPPANPQPPAHPRAAGRVARARGSRQAARAPPPPRKFPAQPLFLFLGPLPFLVQDLNSSPRKGNPKRSARSPPPGFKRGFRPPAARPSQAPPATAKKQATRASAEFATACSC